MTRWTVHSERAAYSNPWVSVFLADVETPSGVRVPEHHVVRVAAQVAGCVVYDRSADAVLMLWRHRFITDSWGHEIPAGRIEPGESPAQAAVRETVEETGWRPLGVRALTSYHPSPGLIDQTFHVFVADAAEYTGDPVDVDEAERIEWIPVDTAAASLMTGGMDGITIVGLLIWLREQHR
jgi:8-oxo-dGTP pyrophosphatase MutT (NUDIX family)